MQPTQSYSNPVQSRLQAFFTILYNPVESNTIHLDYERIVIVAPISMQSKAMLQSKGEICVQA